MIDCARCRTLIDDDLRSELDPVQRTAMANHLRECHDCVAYKRDRLQDSSIVRKSVAELRERQDRGAPPPQPPQAPKAWPWVVVAIAVVGLIAVGVYLLTPLDEPDDIDDEPTSVVKDRPDVPPDRRPTAPTNPDPVPPPGQEPPRREPALVGVVRDAGGRPVAGADVLLSSPNGGTDSFATTRTGPGGAFSIPGRPADDAIVCATKDGAVAGPVAASAGLTELRLQPGRMYRGHLSVEGGSPETRRLLARWQGGGASVCRPTSEGRFTAVAPRGKSVEVTASPLDGSFVLTPHRSVTLLTDNPVRLRATRAAMLRVELRDRGSPVDETPRWCVLLDHRSEPVHRLTEAAPGDWIAFAPRGDYRLAVGVDGYQESVRPVSMDPAAPPATIRIDLVASEYHLSLRAGRSAAQLSAQLRRHPPRSDSDPALVHTLDANGGLEVRGLPWRAVRVRLVSRLGADYGPFDLPREVNVQWSEDAVVEGTVSDGSGQPLPGVLVQIRSGRNRTFAYANSDGAFAFEEVPAGPVSVFPASMVEAIESGRLSPAAFEVTASPGARVRRPLTLPGARICEVRIRDDDGRPTAGSLSVRSPSGVLAQRVQASVDTNQGVSVATLPGVSPGQYRLDWTENGVVYPLGRVTLPSTAECVVSRRRARLSIVPTWASPFAVTDRPARLSIRNDGGETILALALRSFDPLAIAGLVPGRYHVAIEVGPVSGHGIVDIADPSTPHVVPISLR